MCPELLDITEIMGMHEFNKEDRMLNTNLWGTKKYSRKTDERWEDNQTHLCSWRLKDQCSFKKKKSPSASNATGVE